MPHKLRKVRKMRASRTHGYGQVGQHRKGSKGGKKAGRHKHGWTYVIKYLPDYFGQKGFLSQKALIKSVAINVGELEDLANKLAVKQKLEEKEKKVFLDLAKLGYDKLLGMGKVNRSMLVKVRSHSKVAAKKIEAAGGQIIKRQS